MRRSTFLLVNLAGVGAFLAPFIIAFSTHPTQATARSQDAPWLMVVMALLLLGVGISEATSGNMDPKKIAMLGVLTGCAALLRLPVSIAGGNLIFFLPMICGAVFGPVSGFLVGSLSMATSALITGGIGPWLPFQMWSGGWVGMGAGLLRPILNRCAAHPWVTASVLAVYGAMAAFVFGALMNLYFWPVLASGDTQISWDPADGPLETIRHYLRFYLFTSFVWDLVGAVVNVIALLAAGRGAMNLLKRYERRFTVESS